jgi:hypothetical protein
MLNIPLRRVEGDKVVLDNKVFEALVQCAQTVEDVIIQETAEDLPAEGLMKLVEQDDAFAFLHDPAEDVYTVEDLKERYR